MLLNGSSDMVMLSLILAVSLTSSNLGEFFHLPEWFNRSVEKENTPGSDPSSGDGWYVEEFTNAVYFSDWSMIYISNTLPYKIEISRHDEMSFDVTGANREGIVNYERFPYESVVTMWPNYVIGEDDATNLTYAVHIVYQETNVVKSVIRPVVLTRKKTVVPIASGRWIPRAAKLSSSIQSGVFSSFAAMLERQYYSMQGQTNGWEQGEIWPDINKNTFRFAPDANVSTNVVTNVFWEVEATMGTNLFRFADLQFNYQDEFQQWDCTDVGRKICHSLDLEFWSMNPYMFAETEHLQIDGSSLLRYRDEYYITYKTNIEFSATGSLSIRTNVVDFFGTEWKYLPDSRSIESRRLLDFDNIDRLSDFLSGSFSHSGFGIHASPRLSTNITVTIVGTNSQGRVITVTNETEVYTWFGGPNREDKFQWASTEPNFFANDILMPTLADVRNPTTPYFESWFNCCHAFYSLKQDSVWYSVDYDDPYNPVETLTEKLMMDIDMGTDIKPDPRPPPYNARVCRPRKLPVTMKELIETNFPHADGHAITNDTRRLMSDRLCCMNQAMSLLDRTYHLPTITYTNKVTNITCNAYCRYYAKLPISDFEVYGDSVWLTQEEEELEWGERSMETAPTEGYLEECPSDVIVFRNGGGRTDVSFVGEQHDLTNVDSNKELIEIASLMASAEAEEDGEFLINVAVLRPTGLVKISRDLYIYVYCSWYKDNTRQGQFFIPYDIGTITNVFIGFTYKRNFFLKRPSGEITLSKNQPGWQCGLKASSSYGFAYSYHRKPMMFQVFSSLEIDESSVIRYSTGDGGIYNSREDLLSNLREVYRGIKNIFTSSIGFDPEATGWPTVIIDTDDAENVRDSMLINDLKVTLESTDMCTYANVFVFDNEVEILDVTSRDSSGRYREGYATLCSPRFVFDESHDDPDPEYPQQMSMNAKMGVITRTDWEWSTLKRGND